MKLKLTKISGKPDSHLDPGYWVVGFGSLPKLDNPVFLSPVLNSSLNERWFEWFETTPVLAIEGDVVTTRNSKWRVTEVTE